MRMPRKIAVAAAAATLALIVSGVGLSAASASSRPVTKAVSTGVAIPAAKAKAGWQKDYTYRVPAGTTNLFFHYSCPTAFPIAANGSYHPSTINPGTIISGSFPRTDITPIHTQWGWVFGFSPGSPSGYKIVFNVYCTTRG
jgi:hypothetical protein